MKKQIANIVFYKYYEGTEIVQKSCVFFNDGTVMENLSYEDGIKACEEITKRLHITSLELFKEMINKDMVYAMSGEEFKARFDSFIVNETIIDDKTSADNIVEEKKDEVAPVVTEPTEDKEEVAPVVSEPSNDISKEDESTDDTAKDVEDDEVIADTAKEAEDDEVIADGVEPTNDEIEDPELLKNDKPKKEGFIKRTLKGIKSKLKLIGVTLTTAAVGMFCLTGCEARVKTKEGKMINRNLPVSDQLLDENASQNLYTGNNADYAEYSVDELLSVTNDKAQKSAMSNARDVLRLYNGEFANYYIEAGKETADGKSIKPALKFEEIVALQQAYNDYTKEEIRAIFNGSEVNAEQMTRAYKDASLQLMGAYIIENAEHPVDMSGLIDSQEGKDFYNRYHQMFLAAKTATTYEEKQIKVAEFYKAVKADFPITQEVRTEGISHSSNYDMIESYKLAVTPMIAAAETMYQNLETDVTLNDSEIDFLNDIGLCNYADDKFERIETITLSATEDHTNPSFEQFKNMIIATQNALFEYGVEDERRELTLLDSFQNAVNWHFDIIGEGTYSQQSSSYQTYSKWSTSKTTYRTEETRTEKEITPEAKKQVDAQIAAENAAAKTKAEQDAAKKQQELQAQEDANAQKIEKEVADDAKDLDDKIAAANDQIAKNNDNDPSNDKPINENDLGHGVKFDEDHSDEYGNLNDSVENITTDPQGAVKHDDPLPDPNETGAKFDSQAGTFYGDNGYTFQGQVYEYNTPVTPTYEEAVDSYVENLVGNEYDGDGYQYTYTN